VSPKRLRDRLRRDRPALVACLLLALIAATAVLSPLLGPPSAAEIDFSQRMLAPSPLHPFGTDDLGRDVLVRIMQGGRVSLAVGAGAVLLAVLIGVLAGGVAGFREGVSGWAIMRTVDLFLSIPIFLIVLLASSMVESGVIMLCVLIGCTQWMEVARVVRAVVLATKKNDFVEAARALGVSERRILFGHVLSHASGPLAVTATIVFAQSIMLESAVSFLGFGMQPPAASWGGMLQSAQSFLGPAPWVAVFPGAMIFVTVLCFYTIGDFLRAALSPEVDSVLPR
jgi:peptide/nickel transport system permease protein